MIWLWILRRKGEGGVVSDDLLLHQRPPRDPRPINSPIHCNLPPPTIHSPDQTAPPQRPNLPAVQLCVWIIHSIHDTAASVSQPVYHSKGKHGQSEILMEGGFILAAAANISGSVSQTSQFAFYTWVANLIKTLVPKTRRFQFVGGDWWVGGKGIDEGICFEVFSFFLV